MRAILKPLFGNVPADADNLEICGTYDRRFEERDWATVWPTSGVIRWADGRIETETIWQNEHLKQCGDFNSRRSWFPRKCRGRYFNLSLFWASGYYHWICDVLTRLHMVLPRLTPDIQVILPPRMTAWQSRSLELIGLPQNQWLQYTEKRPWKVEHLFYASPVAMTGDHEAQSLQWMQGKILQACLTRREVPVGKRRLYVSRRRAAFRRIVNESELVPVLKKFNFDIIECESLSFDEQVRLFSDAEVVVGPHGAGLTNVIWCERGVKLFEIFEPGSVRRCYWSLAKTLDHDYACAIGRAVINPGGEANLEVSLDEFESALEKLICNNTNSVKLSSL